MITHHQYRNDSQHNGPCTWKYHVVPCGRPREDHSEVDYKTKARDRNVSRRAFILHVDLDPVPGTFHTPLSAYENIQEILNFHLPSYTPVAIFAVASERGDGGRKRICFVIYVDLDSVPGAFHTQESAQNIIRNLFCESIPHYNPIISLAPASIQPKNIVEESRV